MKIRIYTPFFPYPVTEGAFQVIADQISSFVRLHHQVEIITWKDSITEFKKRYTLWQNEEYSEMHTRPIVHYFPIPQKGRGWRVVHSLFSPFASVELYYYPNLILKQIQTLTDCDLAIYHHSFSYVWLQQPEHLPTETKRVVHFHNLENELFYLRAHKSSRLTRWVHLKNAQKLRAHELQLSQLCHELWFLSPVDQFRYTQSQPPSSILASLYLRPPTYSPSKTREINQLFCQKKLMSETPILGFIGRFHFGPNQDSAQWIYDQLIPALTVVQFQGKIQMAGKGAQAWQMANTPLQWLECLPDDFHLESFFQNLSWMLVPHLSGSGVRIKLLDALCRNIPVLTTPESVERLHPQLQTHPLIFSSWDPMQWAQRIIFEKAFETRKKYRHLTLPAAMNGEEIYRDSELS